MPAKTIAFQTVVKFLASFSLYPVNLKSAEVVPPFFEKVDFRQRDHIEIIDSNGEKYITNLNGDCQVNCENYRKVLKTYYQRKN